MTKNVAFLEAVRAGNYDLALTLCLSFLKKSPFNANALADAAFCYLKQDQFEAARDYALKATAVEPSHQGALDVLSHACGALKRWDEVRDFGRRALMAGDARFGKPPSPDRPLQSRGNHASRKIIAFCLFGANSKYCEPAILNALEQPRLYPGWTCRVYLDGTVPDFVSLRLQRAGAEVVEVDERLHRWPGTMWRFAAYDDPDVERVIFRDADSVISEREAGAVQEWLESGRSFHILRDGPTHTELILAGLWGVAAGALPRMADMVSDFLKRPLESERFADQHFLREFVWPYARQDMLQHDSLFGFLEHRPFPDGPRRDDFHTGACESWPVFRAEFDAPDGTRILWRLIQADAEPQEEICAYPALVRNKQVVANLPMRYALKVKSGEMRVRLEALES